MIQKRNTLAQQRDNKHQEINSWFTEEYGKLLIIFTNPTTGQQLDYLSKAPFYRNYKKHSLQNAKPAYLPVAIDEKVFEEFFYKGRERERCSLWSK